MFQRTVVDEFDCALVGEPVVEVGHQRSYVLRGSQPVVHVITGVDEAARSHGDVADRMPVEWEVETQLYCLQERSLFTILPS